MKSLVKLPIYLFKYHNNVSNMTCVRIASAIVLQLPFHFDAKIIYFYSITTYHTLQHIF